MKKMGGTDFYCWGEEKRRQLLAKTSWRKVHPQILLASIDPENAVSFSYQLPLYRLNIYIYTSYFCDIKAISFFYSYYYIDWTLTSTHTQYTYM